MNQGVNLMKILSKWGISVVTLIALMSLVSVACGGSDDEAAPAAAPAAAAARAD